jgi:DNA-binding NarL/FixJ family response regulator
MARAIEILVVEDEVAVQRLVDVVFRAASDDFLVQRVGTLEAAIKSVLTLTPDVILLDLDLPDAKGLEAVQALLNIAPRSAIVILTANTDDVLAHDAIRLGAQDWLQKNADLQRLLPRAVTFAVERHRIRRDLMARLAGLRETPEG